MVGVWQLSEKKRSLAYTFVLTFCVLALYALPPSSSQAQSSDSNVLSLNGYISLDSWIYPAVERLSSLGYVSDLYLGQRPWTRLEIANALRKVGSFAVQTDSDEEAYELYIALSRAVSDPVAKQLIRECQSCKVAINNLYTRSEQIVGKPLTQDFYFGETNTNDYGRRIGRGFQGIIGGDAQGSISVFTVQVRGEYQHLASQALLSPSIATYESTINRLPYLPPTPVTAANQFTLMDASISVHILGNEISGGKRERWWGPATGGALLWSNNAQPIYEFNIKRDSPFIVPGLSRLLGPVQWDLFLGDLKGHTTPNRPWIQGQKISFHPTKRLEIGFSRTVMFGGAGRGGLTLHTFWRAFASAGDNPRSGNPSFDVGDRRGGFDFRYIFPLATIYADSFSEDDPSPLANLKRSAWRPGFYLPRLPGLHQFDLRFEAPYTNMPENQTFPTVGMNYRNLNYRDGYTNHGRVLGDWIGPDSSGYQAWLGLWLKDQGRFFIDWRMAKLDKSFVPRGGTQQNFAINLRRRLSSELEASGRLQFEQWKVPYISSNPHRNLTGSVQVVWRPKIGR